MTGTTADSTSLSCEWDECSEQAVLTMHQRNSLSASNVIALCEKHGRRSNGFPYWKFERIDIPFRKE